MKALILMQNNYGHLYRVPKIHMKEKNVLQNQRQN